MLGEYLVVFGSLGVALTSYIYCFSCCTVFDFRSQSVGFGSYQLCLTGALGTIFVDQLLALFPHTLEDLLGSLFRQRQPLYPAGHRFDEVEVGLTITSFDEKVRRAFEPGASPIEKRLDALELFSDGGIPTYAFLGPLLPFLSDPGFEDLLNRLAESVSRVIVDRLNIKAGNWGNIEATLDIYYPEMLGEFKEASKEPSAYYDSMRGKIRRMLDERAIPHDILF